jgi:tetratricopeptide (TPR) repeat protein
MAFLITAGHDRPTINKKRRQWSIAPAPAPSSAHFEGYELFTELPNVVGLVLFRWIRDVTLWATSVRGVSQELFRETAAPDRLPEWACEKVDRFRAQANVFANLVIAPGSTDPADVVRACVEISEWADEENFTATAAAFVEAAARVHPLDPELAFRAGLLNRRNAVYGRSALWYQRGIGIARRTASWPSYVDNFLGWGNLEIIRGREVPARKLLMKGYNAAKKYNLRDLSARAQHELFMLAVQQDDYITAYDHAMLALQLYPRDNPFFPYLVHDLAQTWVCQRYGSVALPLLIEARSIIAGHDMEIAANIASAAGLDGDRDQFEAAWDEVALETTKAIPKAASALISVAEGACALRLMNQAIEIAERALRFAGERGELNDQARARVLLEKLRAGDRFEPMKPPDKVQQLATLLMKELPLSFFLLIRAAASVSATQEPSARSNAGRCSGRCAACLVHPLLRRCGAIRSDRAFAASGDRDDERNQCEVPGPHDGLQSWQ